MHPLILLDRLRRSFLSDARHAQLLFLGGFLSYGWFALDWHTDWARYGMTLAAALGTQALGMAITRQPVSSLKSALITGLGLCLLLKTGQPWVAGLAAGIAIGSKFLIRYRGKHLFNPANLGVVATVLPGLAWVSPGQWGSGPVLIFLIGGAGLLVLTCASRLDTAGAFLGTYAGLMALWQVGYLGWPWDHWLHSLSGGALLLFAFFMITDPMTTPNARLPRMGWAAAIAVVACYLQVRHYVQAAPILVLSVFSILVPLLDRYWPASRFDWTTRSLQPNHTLPPVSTFSPTA
ncbi:MAG: RnfABCDGE type electron transport complex subunit D [Bacteroidia bacterium]|nr:RnfABCDGE type electron transport complex subunit D [Bacteroidia bacterium]